jgi:hypothetical protein
MRVATNILNKLSRTADKGWSSSFRFRWGLTTLTVNKLSVYELLQGIMLICMFVKVGLLRPKGRSQIEGVLK